MTEYRRKIYENYASKFQDSGEHFDIGSAETWGKVYEKYLKNWLPESKNATILEVACGDGKLLHFFKKRGYTDLTGIDICREQIMLSSQVCKNVKHADVIDFLGTNQQDYDLIIAIDFIEHLTKDEVLRFFELCFQRLKPSGRIILQTPNAVSPFVTHVFHGDFTHETLFSPLCLKGILKLSGFCDVRFRPTGPVINGLFSFVRFIGWQFIRFLLKFCNFVETAQTSERIFTRVFLASAIKK